jgi:hypothetical protein
MGDTRVTHTDSMMISVYFFPLRSGKSAKKENGTDIKFTFVPSSVLGTLYLPTGEFGTLFLGRTKRFEVSSPICFFLIKIFLRILHKFVYSSLLKTNNNPLCL